MNALPTQEEVREHEIRKGINKELIRQDAEVNQVRHEIMKKVLKEHGLEDIEIEQIFKDFDVEAKKVLELELTTEKLQEAWETIIKKVETERREKGHISFKPR